MFKVGDIVSYYGYRSEVIEVRDKYYHYPYVIKYGYWDFNYEYHQMIRNAYEEDLLRLEPRDV